MQGAALEGYDLTELLQKAEISPTVLKDPDSRIDGEEFERLQRILISEMNDIFVGFVVKKSRVILPLNDYSGKTFEDALNTIILAQEAVNDDIYSGYIIDIKQHECIWSIRYQLRDEVNDRLFYWFRLITNYKLFCAFIGRRIKLKKVYCTFSAPPADDRLDYSILGCEVLFNQQVNGFSFDRQYLYAPVKTASVIKMPQSANWFDIPGKPDAITKQVEEVIASLQREGIWTPTTSLVAKKLNVSERQLRRLLAKEDESFIRIKARVRSEQAMKLLIETDLPITQIAEKVGFDEPGAFTRAFISWTNLTPSAYRANR